MLGEDLQDLLGIQRITLGAAGLKGLPELGHGRGMERIEDQEVKSQQRVDKRSARLLQGEGHGSAAEALPELGHPREDDFRLLFQSARLLLALPRHLQAK